MKPSPQLSHMNAAPDEVWRAICHFGVCDATCHFEACCRRTRRIFHECDQVFFAPLVDLEAPGLYAFLSKNPSLRSLGLQGSSYRKTLALVSREKRRWNKSYPEDWPSVPVDGPSIVLKRVVGDLFGANTIFNQQELFREFHFLLSLFNIPHNQRLEVLESMCSFLEFNNDPNTFAFLVEALRYVDSFRVYHMLLGPAFSHLITPQQRHHLSREAEETWDLGRYGRPHH